MLLLPYGHEHMSFRRMPWVTIGVMVTCILVQVGMTLGNFDEATEEAESELRSQFLAHPHLALPADAEAIVMREIPASVRPRLAAARAYADRYHADPAKAAASVGAAEERGEEPAGGVDEYLDVVNKAIAQAGGRQAGFNKALAEQMLAPELSESEVYAHLIELGPQGEAVEQRKLDEAWAQVRRHPFVRYAFFTAKPLSLGLITHQFLHAGWLHLIGNLLFLWLVGFNLEDRWGRPFFLLFYLLGGAVAALTQAAFTAADKGGVPMVGASGAIAAAMGAFLLLFSSTKIQVFWLHFAFLMPRYGTFSMPAYLVFPAWLSNELLSAWLYGSKADVGHWAHIGGFAFGFAFALVLKYTTVEKRFLLKRLENVDVLYATPAAVTEATTLLEQSQFAKASAAVEALLAERADHPEALPIRLAACAGLGDGPTGIVTMNGALQATLRRHAPLEAHDWVREWSPKIPRTGVGIAAWSRFAHALEAIGLKEEAEGEYTGLLRAHGIGLETCPALIRYAELLVAGGEKKTIAVKALERAQRTIGEDPAWSQKIETLLARARA